MIPDDALLAYIREAVDRYYRLRYPRILICNPILAEQLKDKALGAEIRASSLLEVNKVYLIDRDEWEKWGGT